MGENKKTSKLAITSFILVVLGVVFLTFVLFSVIRVNLAAGTGSGVVAFIVYGGLFLMIIGLILSIISLAFIKKFNLKGKILSIITLISSVSYLILFVVESLVLIR